MGGYRGHGGPGAGDARIVPAGLESPRGCTTGAGLSPVRSLGVWLLVDYGAAHDREDSHGPLSLVIVVAICAPAGVAGLFRPRAPVSSFSR